MSDERTMRQLIRESRAGLYTEIQEFGQEEVYRRRLRRMAADGDLALIGAAIDQIGMVLSGILLSPIHSPEIDVTRGQIMGLRNFWRDLLVAGEVTREGETPPTAPHAELNPLASLSSEDERNPFEFADAES